MTIEAGTVVTLKSGGQAMTVVAVDGDTADCLWCGEEGDFFREKIPTVALQLADDDEEVEDEAENEDETDEDETDEDKADERDARTEKTRKTTRMKRKRKRRS